MDDACIGRLNSNGPRLMPVSVKVDPISRDIELFLADISPAAQSAALASFAKETLDEAIQTNQAGLGVVPSYETFVDGRKGADLETVHPDGRIIFEFDLLSDLLIWIDLMLIRHSPVGKPPKDPHPGLYKGSHTLFVDGVEDTVTLDETNHKTPQGSEYVFLNTQPYARKIEGGLSRQAPDGVYQAVATMATQKFGRIAKIEFTYRRLAGAARGGKEDRSPAIVVTVR
jgi:hypothetical protein